jgi:hypothetical protein
MNKGVIEDNIMNRDVIFLEGISDEINKKIV